LFVREATVLVLGQADGEGGFGYDWLAAGGEVRLYGVKEGDKAALVDTKGNQKGVLGVNADGELMGMDVLGGEWKVTKLG
jgi:alpha-D-xyloside xylohydrolase